MAGILANSASKTMVAGSADNAVSDYVTGEQITLTTTPVGTNYQWSIAKPSVGTVRSNLSDDTGAAVTFTPEAEGYYTVVCIVDGTTYVLRIAVLSVSPVSVATALKLIPVADTTVPTPATGQTLFYSSTQGALAVKRTDGTVHTITEV